VTPSSRGRIVAAFAVIYLVWGATFLAVRIAVTTLPPLTVAATRNLIAGTVLVAAALAGGAGWPSLTSWRRAAVIGGLMFLGNHGGITWAATRLPSGVVALLVATIPLWIIVLEWLVAGTRRPSARAASGLVLGFAGSALLAWPRAGGLRLDTLGVVASAVAALSWASGTVATRRLPVAESTWMSAGLPMVCGGLLLGVASAAVGEWWRIPAQVPAAAVGAVAFLVMMGSLLGFSAYVYLLRRVPATRVATYAYVNPVVALALGAAFAGEDLDAVIVGAGLLSLAGVFLVVSE